VRSSSHSNCRPTAYGLTFRSDDTSTPVSQKVVLGQGPQHLTVLRLSSSNGSAACEDDGPRNRRRCIHCALNAGYWPLSVPTGVFWILEAPLLTGIFDGSRPPPVTSLLLWLPPYRRQSHSQPARRRAWPASAIRRWCEISDRTKRALSAP